ncbi:MULTISPECIES: cytochrome P450 [unclassified Mycolicibacterium]|uniref:cytochrome P450 n=1 Tax=unclassified Mycolicibacterium TaxID=2636767 RepID=UPI0012DF25BF|nr:MULTISPECIES: cytochrome P450 [unclassified Mycolicibacterium]MUL81962.1 cytochrome P450 [Mycolicibacterium sp. CBMA 329]MUL87728.1 cytochrome P450 [Mycolicibacterium sp. CBMA 331]MUL99409.1 cytochrome P450 [Mycolicibacterium sp. CBMA 334]MUM29338.1 cytochrome P450 [Mycolicibacterium sp. CBMA 295]MUM38025.1 cytochrome P450 [Mycolicibacterium sp. CBMA 247]
MTGANAALRDGTPSSLPPLHMRRNTFDPTPELREIRETEGVRTVVSALGIPAYLITRYDDVKAVLSDHERFSNSRPPGYVLPGAPDISEQEQASARAGNLLGLDPPEHQRLRRMLTPEFTIRRMKRLESHIVEIVEARLDAMAAAGPPSDLVADFALPIPSLVICELLGVPYEDRDDFQHRSAHQLDLSLPITERLALQRQSRDYMLGLVGRARRDPGEDILGMLVREHGDELSDDELVGIAGLLLLAGHETTSNMLGLGVLALLRHPDQLAAVRNDPDAVGPAVEELLRWLSIVQNAIPRFTTTEVELAGVRIPAGELVFASLPAGNRDPDFIETPDVLDISRGAPGHLAFGHGVHHCLGAPLARMEMRIAFPALLRRFPNLALAEPFEEVAYRSYHFIYGLKSLAVTW